VTYLSEVLADNPVHYWRLADPTGLLAHDLGSAAFALESSGANPPILGYSGPVSDGGSAVVNTDSSALRSYGVLGPNAMPYTVECWCWVHDYAHPATEMVWSWDGVAEDTRAGFDNNGKVQFVAGGVALLPATVYTAQRWRHLVMTVAAGAAVGYVDGVNVGGWVPGAHAAREFIISGRQDLSLKFPGAIAEVALYGTALTAARVTAHYNAADAVSSQPVATESGGITGVGNSSTLYGGILQQILQSVRRIY
jgi:Concanavalin A-like lectin/glucanases superfamily